MIVKDIEVHVSDNGAHLIAMLVQLASQFKSKINIKKEDKMVNAKSIMGMMAIGLTPGQSIEVNIEGEDETAAAESIENYLSWKQIETKTASSPIGEGAITIIEENGGKACQRFHLHIYMFIQNTVCLTVPVRSTNLWHGQKN